MDAQRLHHVRQRQRRHRAVLRAELGGGPAGLTITITSTNATYLEGAAADYSGVATTGALDQTAVAHGNSTTPDSGATVSVGAGELVVGAVLTGGSPGTVTAGSSQGQAFTMRASGLGSADLEDILVSARARRTPAPPSRPPPTGMPWLRYSTRPDPAGELNGA